MRIAVALVALATTLALAAPPASAQCPRERKQGVYGDVTNLDGEPLAGVVIGLQKNIEKEQRPFTVKTSKKGSFVYPRVELFEDGYRLTLDSDEFFIRDFHLCVRRPSGEIWQDDQGSLTPDSQGLLPVLRFRGGYAYVKLALGKPGEFRPQPVAQAPEGGQAPPPAEAPPAPRELTAREKAEEALALGDLKQAAALFEEALAAAPDDADLRWQRAEVLAKAGETGAALREARKVLGLQPGRAGARVAMAEWMSEMGQLGDAVPLLEEQRGLTPGDTKVLALLVSAYERQGNEAKVRETLEAWREVAPNDPEMLLGLAGLAAKRQDFSAAQEIYEQLAQADPEHADRMYTNVGISIMNKPTVTESDRRLAADAFRRGLEVNPDYARAHIELGYALLGLGDLDEARQHFRRFLEIAPQDPRAAEVKGVLAALSG